MAAVSRPLGERRRRGPEGAPREGHNKQAPVDDPGRLTATDRSLAILDLVLDASVPLPARAIGEALALPKATVHRLLAALEGRGLLGRDPATGGFTVGAGLGAMAFRILRRSAERGPVHLILGGLAAEIGESCNLGVLDNGVVRFVERVESRRSPLRLDLGPGSTVPLHCSAIGKVFLAGMPERLRRRYLAALSLVPHGPNTILDGNRLAAELERVRAEGVATDDEELVAGVNCLAVPVPRGDRRMLAAVAVQAPKARSDLARLRAFLPALREAAGRLGAAMAAGLAAASPASRAGGEAAEGTTSWDGWCRATA